MQHHVKRSKRSVACDDVMKIKLRLGYNTLCVWICARPEQKRHADWAIILGCKVEGSVCGVHCFQTNIGPALKQELHSIYQLGLGGVM